MRTIKIGRNQKDNDVIITNDKASRYHCTISLDNNGRYFLEDHSLHGTTVNGKLLKNNRVQLQFDSIISILGEKLPWLSYFKEKKQAPIKPQPVVVQVAPPPPVIEVETYDMNTDFQVEYDTFRQNIIQPLNNYKIGIHSQNVVKYQTFSDELLSHSVESYNQSFYALAEILEKASFDSIAMQNKFNNDLKLLENTRIKKMIIDPMQSQQVDTNEIFIIEQRKSEISKLFSELKSEVRYLFKEIAALYEEKHPLLFENQYETAKTSNAIWNTPKRKNTTPVSTLFVGKINIEFLFFDEKFTIQKNEYISLLNEKHVIAYYNAISSHKCFDFVNTLTGRCFVTSMSGEFSVSMFDIEEMNGTCEVFKRLNKKSFEIYSREKDIEDKLEKIVLHIENIVQNVLHDKIRNLAEFNFGKENPQGYQLLIFKGFPVGISGRGLQLLKKILKNGVRAGVNVFFLIDEDELKNEENLKLFNSFNLDAIKKDCTEYDFTTEKYSTLKYGVSKHLNFEILKYEQLQDIVQYVNKGFESKKEEILKLTDYLILQEDWWTRSSANYIEIPFGISENLKIQKLQITQESGQNSAIVIGIPGSGKSVFLHSIITNAVVNYSPDELELYLIDFSGVEFNTYALHHLPHAKVIAPEAEREFGLSVLRELKEEGSRRMELCRNNEVGNIVDLREKNPGLKVPRQLVIIDEFQKLFEIENDKISQESQSIIEIIIREFRKFGINIILATQTLKGNPIDMQMIANRVVFQYSPSDSGRLFEGQAPSIYRTGECIYNAHSGAVHANNRVQTFFISQKERDNLLVNLNSFAGSHAFTPKNTIVFRSDALQDFRFRKKLPKHNSLQETLMEVGIYLGEHIAIADHDVYATFRKLSGDNLLIIGGEEDVAQKIAIYSSMSAMDNHSDNSARFCFFNFMQATDPQVSLPNDYFSAANFDIDFPNTPEEIMECLNSVVEEINLRKGDINAQKHNIYLSFYDFQRAWLFNKVSDYKMSDAAQLLDYILKNGPLVGVYTILQIDKLDNLKRILEQPLQNFAHRIALQMDENASQTIMGNYAANKLFIMNRPSSKYRAYYFNNDKNILAKFKPYK